MDNLKWLFCKLGKEELDHDFIKGIKTFCDKVESDIVLDEAERIVNAKS